MRPSQWLCKVKLCSWKPPLNASAWKTAHRQFGCEVKNKSSGKLMFRKFSQSCSWITPHPDRLLRPPWRTGPAWCSLPLESTSLWKCPVRGGVWPAAPCTHQEVGLLWPPPPYWVWINRMAPGERTRSKTELKDREMVELTWYALPTSQKGIFFLSFIVTGPNQYHTVAFLMMPTSGTEY